MKRSVLVLVAAASLVACSSSQEAPYELEEDVVPTKPSKGKSKNDSADPAPSPPAEEEPDAPGAPAPGGAGTCSGEASIDA
jgi:hypothetical protein